MEGCIEWAGTRCSKGYGIAKRKEKAHRKAWRESFGPIPDGLYVCHKCDNPPCINPEHLFLGTHADNMRDKSEKGRSYKPAGEKNHAAVVTEEQAKAIILDPRDYPVIAREYGLSRSGVCAIKKGRSWPDLDRSGVIFSKVKSKITPEQVASIRNDPRGCKKISKDYGVAERTIILIKKRQTFKYLP